MKYKVLSRLLLIAAIWTASVQAAGRIIVRVNGGLPVVQAACAMAGCTVAENIDVDQKVAVLENGRYAITMYGREFLKFVTINALPRKAH